MRRPNGRHTDYKAVVAELTLTDGVTEEAIFVREYRFRPEEIRRPISVYIWYEPANGPYPYRFELSHHIQTPLQTEAHVPSTCHASNESAAVKQAVAAVMGPYKDAVEEGHDPDDSWLVPSPTWEDESM